MDCIKEVRNNSHLSKRTWREGRSIPVPGASPHLVPPHAVTYLVRGGSSLHPCTHDQQNFQRRRRNILHLLLDLLFSFLTSFFLLTLLLFT